MKAKVADIRTVSDNT